MLSDRPPWRGATDPRSQLWTQASSIVHGPLGIGGIGRNSPIDVAAKAELPKQGLEEGHPLVELWVLQLEDDGDVRANDHCGVGGDDRAGGDRAHGAAGGRGGRRVGRHGMEADESASRGSREHTGAKETTTRDFELP